MKEGEINLPKHMAEHLYMFAGESIWTRFKAKNYIIDQIIDWFGLEPRITKIDENEDEVCSFFAEFIKRFNSAAKEKYGEKYIEDR